MAEPLNIPPVPAPVDKDAETSSERAALEVADPDGREAVVIGIEWDQEGATDDGDVRRQRCNHPEDKSGR